MLTGMEARTGKTWPLQAVSAPCGPVSATSIALCVRSTADLRLSELSSSLRRRMASCSTARASRIGRNCCREMAKSVASQTLALTRCVVLPALSLMPGREEPRLPLLLPPRPKSAKRPLAWLPQLPVLGRGPLSPAPLAPAPLAPAPPPGAPVLLEERGVAAPGHWARTSEALEAVSTSREIPGGGWRSKRSKVPSYSSVSPESSVVLDASLLRTADAKPSLNSSRSSGRQASGGNEQPKYSWKVMSFLLRPFFLTETPKVPQTSKRSVLQPLISHGGAIPPSHVVASATARLSSFMSHCMTSAETKSPSTAPASSLWRPSVTSTTVRLLWFSIRRLPAPLLDAVAPPPPPLPAPWKSVVSSRRLLSRKRFQEARVESTRREVPRLRKWTTSEGASLFTKGSTGDSNSHLIRHSKSGSNAKDVEIRLNRLSQRSRSRPCMLSKSSRTSCSSPRLTASSRGDQPWAERKRGSASASRRCLITASYSLARGLSSTASISGVALWASVWLMFAPASSSALTRGRSASQTALCKACASPSASTSSSKPVSPSSGHALYSVGGGGEKSRTRGDGNGTGLDRLLLLGPKQVPALSSRGASQGLQRLLTMRRSLGLGTSGGGSA
mmetsp:Transcript_14626/g.29678  ORF Transcript_14626/g.29678 Transcript_14626/m.29678 type:complete len:617 (-) Transcript_14626:7-1857(-)